MTDVETRRGQEVGAAFRHLWEAHGGAHAGPPAEVEANAVAAVNGLNDRDTSYRLDVLAALGVVAQVVGHQRAAPLYGGES